MRAVRNDTLSMILYDEKLLENVARFFKDDSSSETLYVLKEKELYGIITRYDYKKNRGNENAINTRFTCISWKDQSEQELTKEAESFFLKKDIREIPVVNVLGELCFSFVREGTFYDVIPGRFAELYSGDEGLANYVARRCAEGMKISANCSGMLTGYLEKHLLSNEYTVGEDGITSEELFVEYEFEVLKSKKTNILFMELPRSEEVQGLNAEEKERIRRNRVEEKHIRYYLKNYGKDISVTELVHRILDEEVMNDAIMAQEHNAKFVTKNGLYCNVDFASDYVNIINGRRVTTDVPREVEGHVYLFGPCTVFGMLVDDKNTLASCLQRVLNKRNVQWEVVNEGKVGMSLAEQIRKFNRGEYEGKSVVLFALLEEETALLKKYLPDASIISLTECFSSFEFHDYFLDLPRSCNKVAMERMAEFLWEYISESMEKCLLNDSGPAFSKTKEIVQEREVLQDIEHMKIYAKKGKNGAIVMNCNPFTNGHLYLIEQAASQVDNLYIFVVSEDKSKFLFEDRIRLVKEGVKDRFNNVTVLPSGKLILSAGTFPEYFIKENVSGDVSIDTTFDLELFAKYIAPVLNIVVRFAGEEPFDVVTRQYNRDMRRVLPRYGIEFVEIPRKKEGNEVISASRVRALLEEGAFDKIKEVVPEVTYCYLLEKFKCK